MAVECKQDIRFQAVALRALHEAAEDFLTSIYPGRVVLDVLIPCTNRFSYIPPWRSMRSEFLL